MGFRIFGSASILPGVRLGASARAPGGQLIGLVVALFGIAVVSVLAVQAIGADWPGWVGLAFGALMMLGAYPKTTLLIGAVAALSWLTERM